MTSLVLTGLGLATAGCLGKFATRILPLLPKVLQNKLWSVTSESANLQWKVIAKAWTNARYHQGGFEHKMSKREAYKILGVSSSASPKQIVALHKRVMLLNHPDRGGSPYLAAKINEAKDTINKF